MTATEERPAATGTAGTADTARPAPRYVLNASGELRTTRYSDVCGGTDEFKRVVAEESDTAATPEGRAALRGLVDDGIYMLARMEVRLREYQAFRDELARLVESMRAIPEPRLADAQREAETLRALLSTEGAPSGAEATELMVRAEEIRQVANDMEGALRRHKEAVIAAGKAYVALMRERPATDEEIPGWIPQGWLPPAPHREKIVDWLKRSRATLLSDEEAAKLPVGPQGREPWVQFEDGGVMPLRVVRWNEEVRNFHPMGTDPHPRGRLYRRRAITSKDAAEAAARAAEAAAAAAATAEASPTTLGATSAAPASR
ncbi:MAG TPA: hypothetical protein VFX49_02850 [Chloroflexota bacterium]|nr:hypothetical protein [Chloroflexota bacterium]